MLMLSACIETFEMTQWGPTMVEDIDEDDFHTENSKTAAVVRGKKVKSEALLNADGQWNVIEANRSYDPAKAHLEARNNVNTKNFKKNEELSAHFKPDAKSGQDGKVRVLKLKPQGPGAQKLHAQYEAEALRTLESLEEKTPSTSAVPIPQRKPVRDYVKTKTSKPVVFATKAVRYDRMSTDDILEMTSGIPVPMVKPGGKKAQNAGFQGIKTTAQKGGAATKSRAQTIKASIVNGIPVPGTKPFYGVKKIKKAVAQKKSHVFEQGKRASERSSVVNIRSGKHSGKTRLVLELSQKTKYKAAVDPLRNVLRIKLENARMQMKPQGAVSGSALLGTYVTRNLPGNNILLEVRMKKKAKIKDILVLPPNKLSRHRLVIDLIG